MTKAEYSIIKLAHDSESHTTWYAGDCVTHPDDAADLINEQNTTIGVLIAVIDQARQMVIIDPASVRDKWGFASEGRILDEYHRQAELRKRGIYDV